MDLVTEVERSLNASSLPVNSLILFSNGEYLSSSQSYLDAA